MAEINFIYNGIETIIQCETNYQFKEICKKYCIKLELDINELIFIYGGEILNLENEFNKVANQLDKEKNKMKILVYDKNSTIINTNERKIKSKDIICPNCGELCLINFNDYKIILEDCKNGHENIISLNEFENKQNINENKIICNICNNKNKGKTYNNKFYRCGICNINICPLCKDNHNKEHKIIDYDEKNYKCNKHNEQYISYCEECKNNLCMQCDMEHDNNHKIILYREIKPNIDNIKNRMKELKEIIDKFNNNSEQLIILLKCVKENIEEYYNIYNNIIKNYDIKNRNYEIFYNLNNINNDIIIKDLKEIINENNIINKFTKIYNIYDKMNKYNKKNEIDNNNDKNGKEMEINKEIKSKLKEEENKEKNKEINEDKEIMKYKNEINLIYKTKGKGKQNIFGEKFVENNKDNIELIINGKKSELIKEYELEEGNNNIKLIIKNNLINLEKMFYKCETLYNIDELKYLNTNYCTNFSHMFFSCQYLSDIK